MKKILLLFILIGSYNAVSAQYSIFMQIIENKKICNKEDELTYFLQAHSFVRGNENRYYNSYPVDRDMYTTCIINENECYVTYRTNNKKDYEKIKEQISSTCAKELAADKSVSYACNYKRVQDVQIMFIGYSEKNKTYDILIYQNPDMHEDPYYPSRRIEAPAHR